MKYFAAALALAAGSNAVWSRMFASSTLGDGDWGLGGNAQVIVDAFCANEAGGDLNFIGLLSADGVNMRDRVTVGTAVARNFFDNSELSPSYDQMFANGFINNGARVLRIDGSTQFTSVWTGSDDAGLQDTTCASGNPLVSWATNADGGVDTGGFANPNVAQDAVNSGDLNCNVEAAVYCYESVPQSSGTLDPHFYGFNGEKLDIEHDEASADRVFSVFCTEDVEVNALFSSTVDGLLFMTKFWMRFQENRVTYTVADGLKVAEGSFEKDFVANLNRTRYTFENGLVVEQDSKMTRFNFNALKVNVAGATLSNDEFLNVDIISTNFERYPAGGLVGRTMTRRVPAEEFNQYEQFKLEETSEYFNTKCTM